MDFPVHTLHTNFYRKIDFIQITNKLTLGDFMSDWRDSKLFLAASFCITGFVAASTLTFTYVIPVYQKQDGNTITALNEEINNLNKSQKEKNDSLTKLIESKSQRIDELKLSNAKLTEEIIDYKSQLLLLSTLSTFQHGQSLPIGYSSILPGMKLSDVISKYKKEKLDIDPKGGFITVKVESGGIDNIMYATGVEETPDIITDIIVSKYDLDTSIDGGNTGDKANNQPLLGMLQENLGQTEPCGTGQYIWSIDKYRYVYYSEDMPYFYRIFFRGIYAPGTSSKCLKLTKLTIENNK